MGGVDDETCERNTQMQQRRKEVQDAHQLRKVAHQTRRRKSTSLDLGRMTLRRERIPTDILTTRRRAPDLLARRPTLGQRDGHGNQIGQTLQGRSGGGKSLESSGRTFRSSGVPSSMALPSMDLPAALDGEIDLVDVEVDELGSKGYDLWIMVGSSASESVVLDTLTPDARTVPSRGRVGEARYVARQWQLHAGPRTEGGQARYRRRTSLPAQQAGHKYQSAP